VQACCRHYCSWCSSPFCGRPCSTSPSASPREANISRLDLRLSLGVSVVLLLIYAVSLVYTLITNRNMFTPDAAGGEPEWSVGRALAGREPTRRGRLSDDALAPVPVVCGTEVEMPKAFGANPSKP
jgi:hypothetical protein